MIIADPANLPLSGNEMLSLRKTFATGDEAGRLAQAACAGEGPSGALIS